MYPNACNLTSGFPKLNDYSCERATYVAVSCRSDEFNLPSFSCFIPPRHMLSFHPATFLFLRLCWSTRVPAPVNIFDLQPPYWPPMRLQLSFISYLLLWHLQTDQSSLDLFVRNPIVYAFNLNSKRTSICKPFQSISRVKGCCLFCLYLFPK